LFLIIIGSKRGIGELFSTTVAKIAANRSAIGFSKGIDVSCIQDAGNGFSCRALVKVRARVSVPESVLTDEIFINLGGQF
jgi:hypothetical protein